MTACRGFLNSNKKEEFMEKMFIEALAELKGGKKKLRELLDTVLEEF